jgi:hypothetical protein
MDIIRVLRNGITKATSIKVLSPPRIYSPESSQEVLCLAQELHQLWVRELDAFGPTVNRNADFRHGALPYLRSLELKYPKF